MRTESRERRNGRAVVQPMDYLLIALVVAVVVIAFVVALRAYTRRQVTHGDKPVDTD